jgi:hypothetical protein
MATTIPSAELVTISPAGHPGFIERSGEYDEAIGAFTAQCMEHAAARDPLGPAVGAS